jgi:hypothetical protein
VAPGLWAQDYKTVLNSLKNNGYTVIRFTKNGAEVGLLPVKVPLNPIPEAVPPG